MKIFVANFFYVCYNKRATKVSSVCGEMDITTVYGTKGLGFDFSHKKETKNLICAISSAG